MVNKRYSMTNFNDYNGFSCLCLKINKQILQLNSLIVKFAYLIEGKEMKQQYCRHELTL